MPRKSRLGKFVIETELTKQDKMHCVIWILAIGEQVIKVSDVQ